MMAIFDVRKRWINVATLLNKKCGLYDMKIWNCIMILKQWSMCILRYEVSFPPNIKTRKFWLSWALNDQYV